jgi:hypothetical protein
MGFRVAKVGTWNPQPGGRGGKRTRDASEEVRLEECLCNLREGWADWPRVA